MASTQNYTVPNFSAHDRCIVLPTHLHSLHGLVHNAGDYAGASNLIPHLLDTSGHNVCCLGAVLRMSRDNHRRIGKHSCIWASDLGLGSLHEVV